MNCKICSKFFDSSIHKPIVLFDCVHTFCNQCISNISKCPSCSNEIKSKTTNWEILDLIEEGAIPFVNQQENLNIACAIPINTETKNPEPERQKPIESNQEFIIIDTPERKESKEEFEKGWQKVIVAQHFKAIEHFDKGIRADPTYFENYMRKAYVLNCLNKYADVVECYKKAIEHLPNEFEGYYGKALALVNLKKYKEAIDEYDEILKMDPKQTDAKLERENCLKYLQNDDFDS